MSYAPYTSVVGEGPTILRDLAKVLHEAHGGSPTQPRRMSGLLCPQWDSALQYRCLMAWQSPRMDE